VDYLKPTPLGVPLEVRGKIEEITDRKVIVTTTVSVNDKICAKGRVVAVQMPAHLIS
jgi:acyl-CoA thioesterase FadM